MFNSWINGKLFWITYGVAIAESFYCLGQQLGLLPANSSYFAVTGTFSNPNITAMLMVLGALGFPYLIKQLPKMAKLLWISLACVLLALYLLHCRSAWLGMLLGVGLYLHVIFDLRLVYKKVLLSRYVALGAVVGTLVVFTTVLQAYKSKKASADGRLLIWKISGQMISVAPFEGYGFGEFEKDYNKVQAQYFASGKGSVTEIRNANHVRMAYNDVLQHTVEGGVFAGVLWALALGIFLWRNRGAVNPAGQTNTPVQMTQTLAYIGVAVFALMSTVNFAQQAPPLFAVFLCYFMAGSANESAFKGFAIPRAVSFLMGSVTVVMILFKIVPMVFAAHHNKYIVDHYAGKPELLGEMRTLAMPLAGFQSFWTSYAQMLREVGQYSQAMGKYERAAQLSSEEEIYLGWASASLKVGHVANAESCYQYLANNRPNWLLPKMALLKLYQQQQNKGRVVALATQIVNTNPKIKNKKSREYQQYAKRVLEAQGLGEYKPSNPSLKFFRKRL